VYGADEHSRLGFIKRLKTLGLTLVEIRELNAVYAIAGSTEQMLDRLVGVLDLRLGHLDARITELERLREEMVHYRDRVRRRIGKRKPHGGIAR
jgi:DNA-binding transcriptional MerR regulator